MDRLLLLARMVRALNHGTQFVFAAPINMRTRGFFGSAHHAFSFARNSRYLAISGADTAYPFSTFQRK
jgi:hypothetical protein